ncbi:hypothetical protein GQ53DRAFT_155961 [Thozetella sp. PMI_491]|nr:hypothetical protein GQ53DRAFT_155961 [Thozetella sp. PMI_491]
MQQRRAQIAGQSHLQASPKLSSTCPTCSASTACLEDRRARLEMERTGPGGKHEFQIEIPLSPFERCAPETLFFFFFFFGC